MGLEKIIGNTLIRCQRNEPANTLGGVEIDYYFMASRFAGSKTEISMSIWTVIVDCDGFIYAMRTEHLGRYEKWQEVLAHRIKVHLYSIGMDNIVVMRLVRDIEIQKEGHLIPNNTRCASDRIGIDGSDEVYIRRSKFSYIK